MKALFAAAATILQVSVSPPFILEDGESMDFWNWPAFVAHYAYLDTDPSEVAQPIIWIDGSRQENGTFRLLLTGIDPTAAFPHNVCRREIVATLDGNGLRGTDPSGEFGTFALRPEGGNVRLVQIEPGACAKPGIYNLPKPVD